MTDDRFWHGLFALAGLLNLVVGALLLLFPGGMISALGLTPVADPLFPRLSGVLIAGFGLSYGAVARDLERREIVWIGAIGKLAAMAVFVAAWWSGSMPGYALALGSADLALAGAFAYFLLTTRGTVAAREVSRDG